LPLQTEILIIENGLLKLRLNPGYEDEIVRNVCVYST
jgi:hypothetical protein